MAECLNFDGLATEEKSFDELYDGVEDLIDGWLKSYEGNEDELVSFSAQNNLKISLDAPNNLSRFKWMMTVLTTPSVNENNTEMLNTGSSGILTIEDYGKGRYLTYRESIDKIDLDDKTFKSGIAIGRLLDHIRYCLPYKKD